MIPVKRIYLLYLQTVVIIAGPGVTKYSASKQHVHGISNLQSNKLALVILHSKMSATDVR